jgi:murein tripeptide amidase MpaA
VLVGTTTPAGIDLETDARRVPAQRQEHCQQQVLGALTILNTCVWPFFDPEMGLRNTKAVASRIRDRALEEELPIRP